MKSYDVFFASILFLIALVSFVISYFQFKEKGFLFNNAYIYATKTERAKLNKKPYYRQTAIVFAMIGVQFFLLALQLIVHEGWINIAVSGVIVILIVYAILSTIKIACQKLPKE